MDHNPQNIKWSCLLIPIRNGHLAYITCSLALVVACCGCDSQSTAHASSTDVAPMINAQIQALSPQGGTVDLRTLTGMQFVDSEIVVDHPVNLLGAATFTCGAAISGPCIRVTRPSHIEMMRASTPSDHGLPVPEFGTRITAAPGFTGFLISVEGIQNWNTAFEHSIRAQHSNTAFEHSIRNDHRWGRPRRQCPFSQRRAHSKSVRRTPSRFEHRER
jgi:hypothetical protein